MGELFAAFPATLRRGTGPLEGVNNSLCCGELFRMDEPRLGSPIPTGVILRLEDIFYGVGVALDGEPARESPFSVWFCSVLCSMVVILGLVVGCLVLV
jgi:hypothetical protein